VVASSLVDSGGVVIDPPISVVFVEPLFVEFSSSFFILLLEQADRAIIKLKARSNVNICFMVIPPFSPLYHKIEYASSKLLLFLYLLENLKGL
jgi:hypothetical protein